MEEAEQELEEEEALVELLTKRLLTRLFNAAAGAHREQWKSLLGLDKDPGSVGIRKKLKVEMLRTAAQDAPISFAPKKALGKLDAVRLHALLSIIADEAESELQKLNKAQMQALMKAYYETDAEVLQQWPSILQNGTLKAEVQAALLATIRLPDSKLFRYDPSEFD